MSRRENINSATENEKDSPCHLLIEVPKKFVNRVLKTIHVNLSMN